MIDYIFRPHQHGFILSHYKHNFDFGYFRYAGQDPESGKHLWERIDDVFTEPRLTKPIYRHYDPCEMTAIYIKKE